MPTANRYGFILLLLSGILLASCNKSTPPVKAIRPVLTQAVTLEALWNEVSYSGDVHPRFETSLGFRIGGKIIERPAEVGDHIKPGTLLARLDPKDSELAITNATAQVAAAQADFDKARADLKRYESLLKKKYISQSEYTSFKNLFNVANARLQQAKAELAVTRNKAGYTELRSDREGVITAVMAELGQVVAAGQPVVKLALSDEKEVVIAVPENRRAELAQAQEIKIELWALPKILFDGKIREISPDTDPITRTYAVKVTILSKSPQIQLGMTATVFFRRRMPGLMARLPLTALYQDNGQDAVWLVDPETKKVELTSVEVAAYRENTVIIKDGLKPGQIVVIAGVHKLAPGQRVRLIDENSGPVE